jgi:hypothetical protein
MTRPGMTRPGMTRPGMTRPGSGRCRNVQPPARKDLRAMTQHAQMTGPHTGRPERDEGR